MIATRDFEQGTHYYDLTFLCRYVFIETQKKYFFNATHNSKVLFLQYVCTMFGLTYTHRGEGGSKM